MQRMAAERIVARAAVAIDAVLGFEPLPVVVDERHRADRRAADAGGDARQVVVGLFRQRVEDVEIVQVGETLGLVRRLGRWDHRDDQR